MSLEIEAGYMRVTAPDGAVCLDTRDALFHVLSRVNGSVIVPELQFGSSTSSRSRTGSYACGSVASGCTHLLGFCQISYSTGYSILPSGLWYSVGGTILPEMQRFQSISGSNGNYISTMQLLTFELSGTSVVLSEETRLADDYLAGPLTKIPEMTVTFRLSAGRFN